MGNTSEIYKLGQQIILLRNEVRLLKEQNKELQDIVNTTRPNIDDIIYQYEYNAKLLLLYNSKIKQYLKPQQLEKLEIWYIDLILQGNK